MMTAHFGGVGSAVKLSNCPERPFIAISGETPAVMFVSYVPERIPLAEHFITADPWERHS